MASTSENFQAPEILAALRKLQADLAATRADIRTVADRQSVGKTSGGAAGGEAGISSEVERTTGALNQEAEARGQNIALAREELVAQREITAEVERTYAMYAKLAETRGAGALTPRTSAASAGEAEAAVANQQRLQRISQPSTVPIGVPALREAAQAREDAARAASTAAPAGAGTAALGVAGGAEKAAPALKGYSQELTNVSQRQAEFTASQLEGGAANSQFVSSLARGDASLGEFGAQLGTTIGKFAQWTAAAGGVFAVIGIFTELYKGARDSASGVSQLQRSIDGLNTEKAQSEFHRLASELNIPIKDASDAVFQFSRTFPNLENAVAAASVGLRAQKVDNVELMTSVRALTAVHQQFGIGATQLGGIFDLLDEGQRRYNARVGDTLAVLSKSSAAVKDAGGNLQQLIQLATFASRVTGQPGNQIGTAFYRAASNTVQNPTNQSLIKNLGLNPAEAANEFTQFLITAIRTASGKSNQWKRELAIAIGGKQQGGKVFEPILSADSGLLNQIIGNVTPDKARGSTQQELGRILEQTDERVKSLKLNLEQMGAELERAGAGAGFGLILVGLTDTLKVANDILDAFNLLPHPVKELLVALLEVKVVMALLQRTAIGTGLANATGLAFLGPSPARQATRAERAAQESALGSVQGLQGSTLVREQQLRTQAVVNQTEIALLQEEEATVATMEERVAIKDRIIALEEQSVGLVQEGNVLLGEQAAQQEVATGLQARINALRAGAQPAAGFFPVAGAGGGAAAAEKAAGGGLATEGEAAALVGGGLFAKLAGLPELLKGALSVGIKGLGVGLIADVGAQIASQSIGGSAGKTIGGIGSDVAIGAGVGSVIPGVGTVVGGLSGALFGLVKEDLKGEKAQADPGLQGLQQGFTNFITHLGPGVLKAQAGELSPEKLQQIQRTLGEMLNDPGFEKFRGTLKLLQTQLTEVSKGSSDASQALAKARLFNTYQEVTGESPKQATEHVNALSLKATTSGASPQDVKTLTQELDSLAAQFGGGGNKEGLTALQNAETKLLESTKKNAQDLADKAKADPNLAGKTTSYKQGIQALETATDSIQAGYSHLVSELKSEKEELAKLERERAIETAQNIFHPGSVSAAQVTKREKAIEDLRKTIETNGTQLSQVKKATEYETNQLKAAREAAAQTAFTDISNTIDAQSGLEEARTTDKTVQLRDALGADNQKLKLAGELFGKNSIEYKKALTEVLKAQQSIVEQTVTSIDAQGKLEASQVSGTGVDSGITRAQINLSAQRLELGTLQRGGADPIKIKQLETQINEAENQLAKNITDRAKTVNDALAQIAEAKVLDPLAKARIGLAAATRDERGLTGTELLQQKATVAQKRSDLYQQVTDDKIAQLKYEHSVELTTDNSYISSLEQIIATRKLATSTKRQLLQEIYQLQKGSASGLELNVGSIKLPTIYEIRRAIAGGKTSSLGGQLAVNTTNEFKINVSKQGDEHKVFRTIDAALNTTVRAAARAAGDI